MRVCAVPKFLWVLLAVGVKMDPHPNVAKSGPELGHVVFWTLKKAQPGPLDVTHTAGISPYSSPFFQNLLCVFSVWCCQWLACCLSEATRALRNEMKSGRWAAKDLRLIRSLFCLLSFPVNLWRKELKSNQITSSINTHQGKASPLLTSVLSTNYLSVSFNWIS